MYNIYPKIRLERLSENTKSPLNLKCNRVGIWIEYIQNKRFSMFVTSNDMMKRWEGVIMLWRFALSPSKVNVTCMSNDGQALDW
jgi:hypothetical protein